MTKEYTIIIIDKNLEQTTIAKITKNGGDNIGSESDLIKDRCVRGLQHSEGLDRINETLRESKTQNKYVVQELRRKKRQYVKEILKSLGYVKLIAGILTPVFIYFLSFLTDSFLENFERMFTMKKILFFLIVLIVSNLVTLHALLSAKVKKKMSDINNKEYFNLHVFQEESPAIWEAFASLVNIYTDFTYKEAKELIEKHLSDKEYTESIKNWDKERMNLTNLLQKEKEKVEKIEEKKEALYREIIKDFREEIMPIRKEQIFISAIITELKNKTERFHRGILTFDDLKFIGGYTLYEVKAEKLIIQKQVGLKKINNQANVLKMIRNLDYYHIEQNALSYMFFKNDRLLAMEIEIDVYYREFYNQDNQYPINFLHDIISICLHLLVEE